MNEETPIPHVPHPPSLENFNKQHFDILVIKKNEALSKVGCPLLTGIPCLEIYPEKVEQI